VRIPESPTAPETEFGPLRRVQLGLWCQAWGVVSGSLEAPRGRRGQDSCAVRST